MLPLERVPKAPDGFGLTSGDEVLFRLGQAVFEQADDDIVVDERA